MIETQTTVVGARHASLSCVCVSVSFHEKKQLSGRNHLDKARCCPSIPGTEIYLPMVWAMCWWFGPRMRQLALLAVLASRCL